VAALAVSPAPQTAVASAATTAGDNGNGPFEYLGAIPQPAPVNNGQIMMALDPVGRRLYTTFRRGPNFMSATYDIDPDVPKFLSERVISNDSAFSDPSPYISLMEPTRKRLYLLSVGSGGESQLLVTGAEGNAMASETWEMPTILPGFFAGGMTYSPADDRIYLVGEMSQSMYVTTSTVTFGNKVAGGVATVVALDPDDGALLWARPVPECRFPLYTLFTGSMIARSGPNLPDPTLFVPCSPGSTLLGTNLPYQPGVAALSIAPDATMVQAQTFDVQFYPISGNFFDGAATGIAGYDYGSDRLFLQSLSSRTPGAWVFDAHDRAWVGAITSPSPMDYWLGINQRTGHYYMGGRSGGTNLAINFLLVADGRAARPQNGVVADGTYSPTRSIFTDPQTDRLFLMIGSATPIVVLRDRTESVRPLSPLDYDAQTDDIADTPESFVSFTGDAGGFGARMTTVGDTASVNGTIGGGGAGRPAAPQASRAVTFARGPSTNLQPAGAAAAAEAATLDTTTEQALRENSQAPPWPYGTETCLDGGGGVENAPEQTSASYASVTCDLEHLEAASEARYTAAADGPLTVGDTSYASRTKRTVKDGMTTETTSSSSGIRIDVPEAGSIEIGNVTAKAVTVAHGQKGTASATWTRTVDSVTAKDATGKVVFHGSGCTTTLKHDGTKLERSGSQESCDQLAEAVRKALQVNVRLLFPTPSVVATPKGALASVGQSDVDLARETTVNEQGKLFAGDSTTRRTVPAVQLDIYHDSIERSRHVVQLAGVEATSIFTVNRSLDDVDCLTGGCIAGGDDTLLSTAPVGADLGDSEAAAATDAPASAVTSTEAATGRRSLRTPRAVPPAAVPRAVGLVLARRSLAQGALMASFLLLTAAAVAGLLRRRRLVDLLKGQS
jgi:hypothetical protein